jgi:hypothetical protein
MDNSKIVITRCPTRGVPCTTPEACADRPKCLPRCEEVADFVDGRRRCTKVAGHRARCSFMGATGGR